MAAASTSTPPLRDRRTLVKRKSTLLNLGIGSRRKATLRKNTVRLNAVLPRMKPTRASVQEEETQMIGFAARVVTVESPDMMSMPSASASTQLTRELQTLVRSTVTPRPRGRSSSPPSTSARRPWTAPDVVCEDSSPARGSSSERSMQKVGPPNIDRPYTADPSPLTPAVVRHNRNLQAALKTADERCPLEIDRTISHLSVSQHGRSTKSMHAQQLDVMLEQIEELDASVGDVLSSHYKFVAGEMGEDGFTGADSNTGVRRNSGVRQDSGAISGRQESSILFDSPPDSPTSFDHEGPHHQRHGDYSTNSNLAKAKAQFAAIDSGKTTLQCVCETIASDTCRVNAKLEFFRERGHLLPRTSEFLCTDGSGEKAVDIAKLHSRPLFRLRPNFNEDTTFDELYNLPDASKTLSIGASTQLISHTSSSTARESSQQRSERLRKKGESRDLHIAQVRETARAQQLAKRHAILRSMQQRDCRGDIAARDRTVLVWTTLAIATETLARLWQSFLHLQDVSSRRRGKWKKAATVALGHSLDIKPLMPSALKLLEVTMARKAAEQEKAECARQARQRWWTLIRAIRFVGKLLLKKRRTASAELVKEMINDNWRGYQLRASMKTYLQRMKFLQFSMRACVKLRAHIRRTIYLPALWEVETTILAEVIAMPKSALEAEIENHRANCDLKARLHEAHHLSEVRSAWHAHVELTQLQNRSAMFHMSNTRSSIHAPRASCAGDVLLQLCANTGSLRHAPGSHAHVSQRRLNPQATNVSNTGKGLCIGEEGRGHRSVHPLMEVIEKYRLSQEHRDNIAQRMLRDGIERWWSRFHEYKHQQETFRKLWQSWRLEIAALGPHNRHVWPMVPVIPRFPHELTKIDEKWLHAQVLQGLRQTQAGRLL